VLGLIRSVSGRYVSVRAMMRYCGDGPVQKEIRERVARQGGARLALPLGKPSNRESIPLRTAPLVGDAGCGTPTSSSGVGSWSCRTDK
jgi:hypothetical protein